MKRLILAALVLSGCDTLQIGLTDLERPVASYTTLVPPGSLGGSNARNNNVSIKIETDTRDIVAVFAQEAYEMDLKDGQPVNKVQMELMSHEIEVVVAADRYNRDATAYRQREATSIHNGYDGQFAHMTVNQIVKAMKDRHGDAAQWVQKHNPVLDEFEGMIE
jgi:hypothetical protein